MSVPPFHLTSNVFDPLTPCKAVDTHLRDRICSWNGVVNSQLKWEYMPSLEYLTKVLKCKAGYCLELGLYYFLSYFGCFDCSLFSPLAGGNSGR